MCAVLEAKTKFPSESVIGDLYLGLAIAGVNTLVALGVCIAFMWKAVDMPSRKQNESIHFRARLETQTPLPNGADAAQLRDRVQQFVREAERREPSKYEEMVSTVLDGVARDFFRYQVQKKRSRTL
jgi:hypothetical protein